MVARQGVNEKGSLVAMYRSLVLICVMSVAGCSAAFAPQVQSLSDLSMGDNAASLSLVEVGSSGATNGLYAQQVTANTLLPYGKIARNCGVSRGALGAKVDANAGYTLYDSAPTTTGLRSHYITGFKDKCARQFTAATSLMGDIGTHEIVRYMPSNNAIKYSVTDAAYEAVKAAFCRVGQGVPCGSKMDRLARSTTFITAYERFGSNPTWSNILLHAGDVVAMGPAVK